jgi:hypothetical protein
MTGSELPPDVQALLSDCVPDTDALEVLILLVRDPARDWTPSAIRGVIRDQTVDEEDIKGYLAGFGEAGLLEVRPDGAVAFAAAGPERAAAVSGLITAYNTRPVTLIRTLYNLADRKRIQSFADAFRLRKRD